MIDCQHEDNEGSDNVLRVDSGNEDSAWANPGRFLDGFEITEILQKGQVERDGLDIIYTKIDTEGDC